MSRRLAVAVATVAALGTAALAGPPSPDVPPAGRPLLDELFPSGLPFPFAAVVERLGVLAGPENLATALVPLGRSLQRYGAAPDYFASPRVLVAVTGDRAGGPGTPRLADRLFLGYQPAADAIEAISYNAAAGRFEFQEVVGYSDGARPEPAERRVCLACHQGGGPVFSRPLWSETNANPAIAARLAPLGDQFHGAPVRQTVDGLEAFDAATDRAARLALSSYLWADACSDATCRAALLAAALRLGLGASPGDAPPGFAAASLAVASPDLPNRDPLAGWKAPDDTLETTGRFNPETPRDPLQLWSPADGFAAAASAIAAELSPGDVAWVDGLLRRRSGPAESLVLGCTTTVATLPAGGSEARFACAGAGASLAGFRAVDGSGRVDLLALPGQPPLGDLRLPLAFERTPDGRRLELALGGEAATLTLTDDLSALEDALAHAPGLPAGPFPRAAILALLADLLGGTDG
ncbi:MAG TPA: hypothetical protein VFN28_09055 [Amaricoccus sp.]|nr:hypothetical protein [Amaricoccus sp.]